MQTLKFKTNIKCGGCVAGATPHLNGLTEVDTWQVDLESPDKILTVKGREELQPQQVIQALDAAGFKGEFHYAE